MKTQQKTIFLLLLIIICLVIALIINSLKENPTKDVTATPLDTLQLIEINHESPANSPKVYGLISAAIESDVVMKVGGKIDSDNHHLTPGSYFKKNDVLIKVDRIEILYKMLISRINFKKHMQNALLEINKNVPEEAEKWQTFEKTIERTLPLPDFPKINSTKEDELLDSLNIALEYYKIKDLERQAQDYIFVAPFDGYISESTIQPNSMVHKGKKLMKLAKSNSLQVSAHLPLNLIHLYKNATKVYFINTDKDTLGSGSFKSLGTSISDSSTVEVFFTLSQQNLLQPNTFVELALPDAQINHGVPLPKSAVHNNQVFLFSDNKVIQHHLNILRSTNDSVYVNGLPSHCFVITPAHLVAKENLLHN